MKTGSWQYQSLIVCACGAAMVANALLCCSSGSFASEAGQSSDFIINTPEPPAKRSAASSRAEHSVETSGETATAVSERLNPNAPEPTAKRSAASSRAEHSVESRGETAKAVSERLGIDRGHVTSDQMLDLGLPTPEALRLEGEQCLRTGDTERALTVLQKSVEMAPLDMEGRILYAGALGKKFAEKGGQDDAAFNFLVKQWLFIYKHSDLNDQQLQALNNIAALTRTKPKRFESERKFLARALRPVDQEVAPQKVALHAKDESDNSQIKPDNSENGAAVDAKPKSDIPN